MVVLLVLIFAPQYFAVTDLGSSAQQKWVYTATGASDYAVGPAAIAPDGTIVFALYQAVIALTEAAAGSPPTQKWYYTDAEAVDAGDTFTSPPLVDASGNVFVRTEPDRHAP